MNTKLKLHLNRHLIDLILETGNPISLIPENRRNVVKTQPPPENREFVDLEDSEVKSAELTS